MGHSEQMGAMCSRMGAPGPPASPSKPAGSTTPPTRSQRRLGATIGKATLSDLAPTLQTCTACHAVYRQEVVDEATWRTLVK